MKALPTLRPRIIALTSGILALWVIMALPATVMAQAKVSLQVKTFDQDLKALPNIQIAFNNLDYFTVGAKGTTIIEVDQSEIPLKAIRVKDEQYEAASWNFSKGTIEIIIRPVSYKVIHGIIRLVDGTALPNTPVAFKGKTPIDVTSDQNGRFDLPVPIHEQIRSAEQFSLDNLLITDLSVNGDQLVLQVERPKPKETRRDVAATAKTTALNFDVAELDSISSLAEFYAMFRDMSMNSLDQDTRALIDDKFKQLVALRQDSIRASQSVFIKDISDSSRVLEDVQNLLRQAKEESNTLNTNRSNFESKIVVISSKLQRGVLNLSQEDRKALLYDIDMLEQMLTANESQFYENHNDYREIINTLREKYLDIEKLETRLSEAERLAEEQNRQFRQRLIGIGGVVVLFGALIILLMTFSSRLRRQAKSLTAANERIEEINENLEAMVAKRTHLLEEANKELDTFLYRASHDLRAPVRSMLGLCQIIEHIGKEEMTKHVQLATMSMSRVINKLVDISEIAQESANVKTVDVLGAINKVRNKHLVMMANVNGSRESKTIIVSSKPIQFNVECPENLQIRTSPSLLDNVLANLVENAVFFGVMRKNNTATRVEIKATVHDNNLRLSIYDNGVGISKLIQPKVFNMFFTGNEESRGSGLGLYTVKKSVTAMHGAITLETEEGQFTRFIIDIPDQKQDNHR
ncbi:MAG TPA: ATP-binding protein [Cyclobacteriaceae bacterium]|nr:ATP-binding protein [Cyclobacteriaceae bacterium]